MAWRNGLPSIAAWGTILIPHRPRRTPSAGSASATRTRAWTALWRILTPEQVRQKFAHLSRTRSARLSDDLKDHIAEIQAEQEPLDAARRPVHGVRLAIATRYAGGRARLARRT